ncbi:hypothetical protein D3C72_1442380 [compost metagenome]
MHERDGQLAAGQERALLAGLDHERRAGEHLHVAVLREHLDAGVEDLGAHGQAHAEGRAGRGLGEAELIVPADADVAGVAVGHLEHLDAHGDHFVAAGREHLELVVARRAAAGAPHQEVGEAGVLGVDQDVPVLPRQHDDLGDGRVTGHHALDALGHREHGRLAVRDHDVGARRMGGRLRDERDGRDGEGGGDGPFEQGAPLFQEQTNYDPVIPSNAAQVCDVARA